MCVEDCRDWKKNVEEMPTTTRRAAAAAGGAGGAGGSASAGPSSPAPSAGPTRGKKVKFAGSSAGGVGAFAGMVTEPHAVLAALVFLHWLVPASIVPAPVSVVLMSSVLVYVGSCRSLRPSLEGPAETISQKDAMQYPILGSVVLLSLFLVLKFVPKYLVNAVLTVYFCALGTAAMAATAMPLLRRALALPLVPPGLAAGVERFMKREVEWRSPEAFRVPLLLTEPIELRFTGEEVLGCLAVAPIVGVYAYARHWLANNFMGIAFSLQAIEHISIGSFKIGCILLAGLFFYDIFWVFGTPVMVTVAKGIDAPIKLLFPRGPEQSMSLLGLGDIVIPGLFVALLLRLDDKLCSDDGARAGTYRRRLYFHSAMCGYVAGIAITIAVMLLFNAAQPALLYIVPCVIIVPLVMALAHGELGVLLSYAEGDDDAEGDADDASKKSKDE